jgi:hypothetical protein
MDSGLPLETWTIGGLTMTDIEAPPFGGCEFATGRFRIKCLDLSVYRHWAETILEPASGGKFNTSITGKAVSTNDKVCLIGEDRDESEFALELKSDAYAKEDWEVSRRLEELATPQDRATPEGRIREYIFDELGKAPPTATLFVTVEHGITSAWSVSCALPPDVLAFLESDLLARRDVELNIGIEWVAGLVRIHTTSWGLFTVAGGHGPEPLRGYVKSVGWRMAAGPAAPEEAWPGSREQVHASKDGKVERLVEALVGDTRALKRSCVIGFLAALALIVMGHFLR